jgi:hypothetical protein
VFARIEKWTWTEKKSESEKIGVFRLPFTQFLLFSDLNGRFRSKESYSPSEAKVGILLVV